MFFIGFLAKYDEIEESFVAVILKTHFDLVATINIFLDLKILYFQKYFTRQYLQARGAQTPTYNYYPTYVR